MVYTILATQDGDAYELFPEEMTYINQQAVFKLLAEDSIQAVEGTVLNKFYNDQQNSAIDKLTQVQQAIANNDVSNALALNTSVGATNQVEQRHQRANELTIKYLQDHNCVYSDAEKNDLYSMATECIAKGYYVIQCRNLVNIIQHTVVNYPDNCEAEAIASRKANQKNETVTTQTDFYLYPNPNNGSMILDYDLGKDEKAKVELVDVTGKIISSYKLDSTKGQLEMNERSLQNGIYFYRILVKDKIIKTDKIVIIK
jgi:hypothetical protein